MAAYLMVFNGISERKLFAKASSGKGLAGKKKGTQNTIEHLSILLELSTSISGTAVIFGVAYEIAIIV